MLEGLVTWVLNNYVGEYLENLNADQITIAFLQGQVELENVPLKKTALRKFDVPLKVKSGLIGKLALSVPVTRIRSEPWVLKMSDILMLLEPSDELDLEAVEHYEQSKREQLLEELEKSHKKALAIHKGVVTKEDEEQNQWWGASLISAVLNNIQLVLSNVHIRYEDDTTLHGRIPFNFGIRIQHLSVQTTNAFWKPEFIQATEGANVFKKMEIKGFSVFWNCNQELSPVKSYEELKKALSPDSPKSNTFILKPFSMQMRMEKNTSKFPLKTQPAIPRFKFDLRPEKVNVELTKRHLAQIRLLSNEWARFDRARAHRKWRPRVPVHNNTREWWHFTYNRIVEENQRNTRRHTWNYALLRARFLNGYCKAYRRRLLAYLEKLGQREHLNDENSDNSVKTVVTHEDVIYMKQIERDAEYSVSELNLFREIVFRRILNDIEKRLPPDESVETFELISPSSDSKKSISSDELIHAEKSSQGIYGWVTSWFTGENQSDQKLNQEEINQATYLEMWPKYEEKKLPPTLRSIEKRMEEEILDVLNQSWDDSTILRRDNLLAEIILSLERMILRFVDEEEEVSGSSRIMAFDMRQVASRVHLSPREHRTELSLSVGDMSVQRLHVFSQVEDADETFDLEHFEAEEGSLLFGSSVKFNTQLLFAIGRAETNIDFLDGLSENEEAKEVDEFVKVKVHQRPPLFQAIYRRLAPKLNVLHELDANFAPVSVIYDERALEGLASLFDTETLTHMMEDKEGELKTIRVIESPNTTQFYLSISIPEVLLELKSRRTSLLEDNSSFSSNNNSSMTFACAKLFDLRMGIVKTEDYLTKLKVNAASVVVEDLFEKTSWPLVKTIDSANLISAHTISNSCPDLRENCEISEMGFSLPTSFTSNMNIALNALADDPNSNRSISTYTKRNTTQTRIEHEFGMADHADSNRFYLVFTFIDAKHPHYESEFEQVCL
uniref:Vacuolar protein sorting-associated protein 13D n=1 Tax=Acrobeloides nanus TaxID=290746 RepID=A0A914C821_9BILA